MDKIIEFLEEYSANGYLDYCPKGSRLNNLFKEAVDNGLTECDPLGDRKLFHQIAGDWPDLTLPPLPWAKRTRMGVERELARKYAEQETWALAQEMGCSAYEGCDKCPIGIRLTAERIWRHCFCP